MMAVRIIGVPLPDQSRMSAWKCTVSFQSRLKLSLNFEFPHQLLFGPLEIWTAAKLQSAPCSYSPWLIRVGKTPDLLFGIQFQTKWPRLNRPDKTQKNDKFPDYSRIFGISNSAARHFTHQWQLIIHFVCFYFWVEDWSGRLLLWASIGISATATSSSHPKPLRPGLGPI